MSFLPSFLLSLPLDSFCFSQGLAGPPRPGSLLVPAFPVSPLLPLLLAQLPANPYFLMSLSTDQHNGRVLRTELRAESSPECFSECHQTFVLGCPPPSWLRSHWSWLFLTHRPAWPAAGSWEQGASSPGRPDLRQRPGDLSCLLLSSHFLSFISKCLFL